MHFWLGAAIGLFAGTFMGVLLTCILVASRRELQPEPVSAESFKVVRWDAEGASLPARAPGRNG